MQIILRIIEVASCKQVQSKSCLQISRMKFLEGGEDVKTNKLNREFSN